MSIITHLPRNTYFAPWIMVSNVWAIEAKWRVIEKVFCQKVLGHTIKFFISIEYNI